jgi:hypothetical protein
MKSALLVFALLSGPPVFSTAQSGSATATRPEPAEVPVIVELFTSEGCSSCPPADALLSKMETAQPFKGVQIIAIEEHVDYWNQQGWVDPFSSVEWTDRQRGYTEAFRAESPYTPQMIINGRTQLVGSRADQAVKAVQEAQKTLGPAVQVSASAASSNEFKFTVSVGKLSGLSAGDAAEVWLAITESGLASQVSRGENAGRNLTHASVLRSLRRIGSADGRSDAASFAGEVLVKIKPGWKRENLTAVVLVQEKKSRHILGAAASKIGG